MRVLVAGAGYVGCAVGLRLASRGDEVFALRRDVTDLPGPLQGLGADLTAPETLKNLPKDLEGVVYCASPDATTDAAYERAYVAGLSHLLGALDSQSIAPRRIVLTSSTAVFHQNRGEWVDEESPAEPAHFTGTRVREAERLLLSSGHAGVVLRLGGIYGPGRARLVESVGAGEATYPEGPPRYVNRNHRDDCAAAIEHLLYLPHPDALYIGTDGNPADQQTVLEWLAAELDAPAPRASPPRSSRRAATNKRCRSDRLQATGFCFAYPSFREGYRELVLSSSQR